MVPTSDPVVPFSFDDLERKDSDRNHERRATLHDPSREAMPAKEPAEDPLWNLPSSELVWKLTKDLVQTVAVL